MVFLGLLGIVLANFGFFSGIEHGMLQAFGQASPGIFMVGYGFMRLFRDIERLEAENKSENSQTGT